MPCAVVSARASILIPELTRVRSARACARMFPYWAAQEASVDKDRIRGSAEQAKGKIKEVAGKMTGDSKLEGEGKAQKAAGKIQNTVGVLKDALKEAVDD